MRKRQKAGQEGGVNIFQERDKKEFYKYMEGKSNGN